MQLHRRNKARRDGEGTLDCLRNNRIALIVLFFFPSIQVFFLVVFSLAGRDFYCLLAHPGGKSDGSVSVSVRERDICLTHFRIISFGFFFFSNDGWQTCACACVCLLRGKN